MERPPDGHGATWNTGRCEGGTRWNGPRLSIRGGAGANAGRGGRAARFEELRRHALDRPRHESRRVSPSFRNPSRRKRRAAEAGSCLAGCRFSLNQNWFAGDVIDTAGVPRPRNAMRQRSSRFIASEIADRNARDANHFRLLSWIGAFGFWLNHIKSTSNDGPPSLAVPLADVRSLSNAVGLRDGIRSIWPR